MHDVDYQDLLDHENYTIDTLDDEIRADCYCAQLLRHFHRWLLAQPDQEPLAAGRLAAGADYFLREFMIGRMRRNIFRANPELLRQFGGNWYIVSNLEPNLAELAPMLTGSSLFYRYCAERDLCTHDDAEAMAAEAARHDYFRERIEQFHLLQDNGYQSWDRACPLR